VRGWYPVALSLLGLIVAAAAAAAPPLDRYCLKPAERTRAIHFQATDGARLQGVLLGNGRKGIVLAHQSDGDLCQWLPFARVLAGKGYRALTFDLRDFKLASDVTGAANAMRRHGARRVYLLGASMGGTAVLGAAPSIRPAVSGVIDLSGPVSFGGLDARPAVRRLRSPALFIAAQYDSEFAASTRQLYRLAASRDKRLLITDGTEHGVDLMTVPRPRSLVLSFLRNH
jgi:pimeloyl-ACP methyl ester carboxylesterase